MDTTSFLSIQRIIMVIKREIMENWKVNLFRFIGLYAGCTLIMVGNMWRMSERALALPEMFFHRFCSNVAGSFCCIIVLVSLIYGSYIMESMATKEKRIVFLMLPATMIEKFLARFLTVTVGFVVIVLISALLSEITRYILLPLFSLPNVFRQSVLLEILSWSWGNNGMELSSRICICVFMVWYHSLFILGGCYWTKKAFLKTVGVLMALSLLISIIMVQVIEWLEMDNLIGLMSWLEEHTQWMTVNQLLMIINFLLSMFTILNWWLGYKLFARAQVIKNRFSLL